MKIKKLIAPVRIDFGGGTTDISPFKDKYGGCILNATINRYVVGELMTDDKKTHLRIYRKYSNFFWSWNFWSNEFSLVSINLARK